MQRKVVDVEEFKCNIFFEYSDPFYFYHIYTVYSQQSHQKEITWFVVKTSDVLLHLDILLL